MNGLLNFIVNDPRVDGVIDRLNEFEKKFDTLNFGEEEKPMALGKDILEIENDWEPFVRISINNQSFLSFCDIGSTMSIMPKFIYDSLKFESMIDLPFYHAHANVNTSKIVGRVNNVQLRFKKKETPIDFIILEPTVKGNIILGRPFLRAMRCFMT